MRALLLFLATLSLSMSATSIVSADWHYDFGGSEPPEGLLIHITLILQQRSSPQPMVSCGCTIQQLGVMAALLMRRHTTKKNSQTFACRQ